MPRKIRCTVESITDHGGRVYTVDLAPQSLAPSFRPGQFLHLTVDEYDPGGFWPESRVFSIASSPHDRKRITTCYAVKGRYTIKMEQVLRVGGEVWIKLPYGEFVIDSASDAVLIAGGTGISAFTAFLEALAPQSAQQVWLVYGARSPELLLFQDEILRQIGAVPNLRGLFFTETASPPFENQNPPRVEFLAGRVSTDAVWSRVPEPGGKVFYLSGPPVMLQTLSEALRQRGVPAAQIRTDAWE
jgi:NAD(P)H-flavin reductase